MHRGGIKYLVKVTPYLGSVQGLVDLRSLAVLVTSTAIRRAKTMRVEEALTLWARARLQALN
jgi:hypothetical protein